MIDRPAEWEVAVERPTYDLTIFKLQEKAFLPPESLTMRRSRLFGQLPGRNKLKGGSRLLVSPFPEIEFIPCCCGVP